MTNTMKKSTVLLVGMLFVLCTAMALVVGLPVSTAFAASTTSYSIGDTVEFAGYEWYIIGTETEGVTAPSGCYTLFAKNDDFGSTAFRSGASSTDSTANYYKDSNLYNKMNEIANSFSTEDKANIVARDTLDGICGDPVTNQLVWPISQAEWGTLDGSLRAFSVDYWTRSYYVGTVDSFESEIIYVYNGVAALADGNNLGGSSGVISGQGNTVTSTYAVRPALYVSAEAVEEEDDILYFTQQPQTQYAVEGGSIIFTVKAEAAGTEITEYYKYTWQIQFPDDENWYKLQSWVGLATMTYYGPELKISNVSGTLSDNSLRAVSSDNTTANVKDCLFRCVVDGGEYGTTYSEAGNIVVVAAGSSQDGQDGREVELRNNGDYIQWRYAGEDDTAWQNLIALSELTGADGQDGADGREVQFQVADGYIQWKYDTESDWQNLIALSELTGADGQDGADGREVQFQVADGYIQWKYDTDSDWQNLIALSELTGADGQNGTDGADGQDGTTPQLRVNSQTNMWEVSYDDGDTWTSLGVKATGADGQDGQDGINGTNGTDGQDGKDGVDGQSGGTAALYVLTSISLAGLIGVGVVFFIKRKTLFGK